MIILAVWSVWCIRVRPGHRGKGISHALLDGAVAYARSKGAPAVEGYPVDSAGEKVDLTMAYVGTRKLFEDTGFTKAATPARSQAGSPVGDAIGPALTLGAAHTSRHRRVCFRITAGWRCNHHSTKSRLTTQLTQLVSPIA